MTEWQNDRQDKNKKTTGLDQGHMMTFSMMVLFSVQNNNQTKCLWATSPTWKAIQAWANLGFYQAPGSWKILNLSLKFDYLQILYLPLIDNLNVMYMK